MGRANVSLVNLGCRVNRAELDAIGRELSREGIRIVCRDEAEAIVVNTCAVTSEAQAKTRRALRRAAEEPGVRAIVATGCAASLFSAELEALDPRIVVEPERERVAQRVANLLGLGHDGGGAEADQAFCGGAVTPTGRMRPGLKVQDGCDRRCSYCIVWKARGPARSMPPERVVACVGELISDGAREVVLIGIDLGRYESGGVGLSGLLARILEQTSVGRVRLSSVEPAGVTEELLDLIASSGGRVAPFLHVPLQSGCDATLARMARPYTSEAYARMAERAKAMVPGIALSTDVIVGFPGETDAEFQESHALCASLGFSRLHVFRYSRRPGTAAAAMKSQVDPAVSLERSRRMRALSDACASEFSAALVGTPQLVLCERGCMGTTGGGARVRTDAGLAGSLAWLAPHSSDAAGVLDARGCRIIRQE